MGGDSDGDREKWDRPNRVLVGELEVEAGEETERQNRQQLRAVRPPAAAVILLPPPITGEEQELMAVPSLGERSLERIRSSREE